MLGHWHVSEKTLAGGFDSDPAKNRSIGILRNWERWQEKTRDTDAAYGTRVAIAWRHTEQEYNV